MYLLFVHIKKWSESWPLFWITLSLSKQMKLLKWVKLTHYLWKRPQNRHKCISDINVFCCIWMKIHLVVFVSYLNLQKCVEKTPQTEKFIYSFLNFIICESLHKGRLSCLVCMGLVFALAVKQSSVQKAGYYREGLCHHQRLVLKQRNEQLKYVQNNDPPCHAGIPFLYRVSWEFKKKLKGERTYNEQKWNILFKSYCSFCFLWGLCLYKYILPKSSV